MVHYRDERESALARVQELERENAKLKSQGFTVLDGVGVLLAGFGALFLLVFPVVSRSFAGMYADFGASLPTLTRVVLTASLGPLLASLPAGLIALALRRRFPLARRRSFAWAAFGLSALLVGLCLYGLYAPIFAMAGNLRP